MRILILLAASILLNISCAPGQASAKTEGKMENMKQIYVQNEEKDNSKSIYLCRVTSKACQLQVYIDDVLAFNWKGEWAKSGGTASIPINSLMLHDGIHKYTVKMYPENDMPLLGYQDTLVSGEEYIRIGAVQIEIVYSPKDNISNKTSLGRITSYNDDDEVYEAIGKLPYYEFSGEFEAFNLPAECDGWYKSIDLKEYCENDSDKIALKRSLYNKYKEIYSVLQAKDIDGFIEVIRKREQLIDAMHCFDELDITLRSEEIYNTIANPNEILQPLLDINDVTMEYMGYGKLITLVDSEGRGIIQYLDEDDNLSALDFRFHKKDSKSELEVIY